MRYFLFTIAIIAVMSPIQLFAQDALDAQVDTIPSELVTCQDGGNCSFCDLMDTVQTSVQWITGIAFLIGVILMIYAGYRIVSAKGDVNIVTEGRKLVGNVVIGIFIIIIAASLVDVLLKTITGGDFGFWSPISQEKCGIQH